MFGSFTEKPYFCNEVRTSVVQKKTNKLLINNKNKLIMKKIFTLVCMVFVAMGVNAQEQLPENVYPIKDITWGDITWKNGNNKKDKNNNDMFFLMGTGNGYKNIYCEYFYSDDKGDYVSRPYYTYIDYEAGETGVPGYGLYYKLTPSVSGKIRFNTWVNKGNRKTFVVKASTGAPLVPYVDYQFDGYVNGQNTNTDQPKIDEATGEQAKDNDGNPVWIQAPTYFTADEIKARHDEYAAEQEAAGKTVSPYVIEKGNQAVWGWITFNAEAGETYVIYQQSSQLGFGGFEFGNGIYIASPDKALAPEFAAIVDADGKATNVDERGSVVSFESCGVAVEACGGSVPTEVTPDLGGSGIANMKADINVDAPCYNLAGQKVNDNYKGVVLQNGRKYIVK